MLVRRSSLAVLLALAVLGCREQTVEAPRVDAPPPAEREEGGPEPPAARAAASSGCDALPSADELRRLLRDAPNAGDAGGLFGGRKQWAAIVNRAGELCAVVVSTEDPAAAWPGSRQIAMAKAYTANAFSTDDTPFSTARLYTFAQPGHSLYGLGAANPMHPDCLDTPGGDRGIERRVCGGVITFGGGVPLYRDGQRVGGLGTSGDTACTDHEIAKRMRNAAGLDPAGGPSADDITYASADGASPFTHPLCANTRRNGQSLGDEPAASGY